VDGALCQRSIVVVIAPAREIAHAETAVKQQQSPHEMRGGDQSVTQWEYR
jgi:hypothetical protein